MVQGELVEMCADKEDGRGLEVICNSRGYLWAWF